MCLLEIPIAFFRGSANLASKNLLGMDETLFCNNTGEHIHLWDLAVQCFKTFFLDR